MMIGEGQKATAEGRRVLVEIFVEELWLLSEDLFIMTAGVEIPACSIRTIEDQLDFEETRVRTLVEE